MIGLCDLTVHEQKLLVQIAEGVLLDGKILILLTMRFTGLYWIRL
jgi:hypothetical protein